MQAPRVWNKCAQFSRFPSAPRPKPPTSANCPESVVVARLLQVSCWWGCLCVCAPHHNSVGEARMETTGGGKQGRNSNQADYQTFFSFFGLRENPFRANPDPRYLFRCSDIRRAQNELILGLQSGKSLIVLTGEAGTGKTSLVNHLLASLRQQQIPVAFIFNSHLDIANLFEFILSDFGIKYDAKVNPNLRILLNQWLVEHYQSGKVPVIILDEAQGLSTAVLEEVRMLLNLQAAGESLVRIVLAGQPELDVKLNRP